MKLHMCSINDQRKLEEGKHSQNQMNKDIHLIDPKFVYDKNDDF